MSQCLNGDLRVRVNELELNNFKDDAVARTGKDYQVLIREMITAFNDGRLRIKPTEEQKQAMESNAKIYTEA